VNNRLRRAGSTSVGAFVQNCPGYPTVGISSTAWSYGVSGGDPKSTCFTNSSQYLNWGGGSLIGVSQAGNSVTIASFTRDRTDCSGPVDQIAFTLVP
jgi:hypothetical protein